MKGGIKMNERVLPPSATRVREHTKDEINRKIDEEKKKNIAYYQSKNKEEIMDRIRELDREWDIERALEANASTLILSSASLYLMTKKKGFVIFTGVISAFLLQHALQGWCPPLAVFRRLGIRTRAEIDEEKHSLIQLMDE
jgi:hypothetical protein